MHSICLTSIGSFCCSDRGIGIKESPKDNPKLFRRWFDGTEAVGCHVSGKIYDKRKPKGDWQMDMYIYTVIYVKMYEVLVAAEYYRVSNKKNIKCKHWRYSLNLTT
jgi:hypothetical protein